MDCQTETEYINKTRLAEVLKIFFLSLLSGKLHKDGDCGNNDEVKDGEFVHLLAHTGLPTLLTATRRDTNIKYVEYITIRREESVSTNV